MEIVPKTVSKANAIRQLKDFLGIDYIVAFGDGRNDIEMFEIADESYAVENAVDELKEIATGIIGSNDADTKMLSSFIFLLVIEMAGSLPAD